MKKLFVLGGLLVAACTEAPKPQPLPATPDAPDLSQPNPADLSGVVNPSVDLAVAAPTISSVSPRKIPTTGGTVITISGANFVKGAVLTIGGQGVAPGNITALTPTQITFTAPPLPGAFGAMPLVVRNPDGQSATTSNAQALTYYSTSVNFPQRTDFQVDSTPYSIAIGDVNSDGNQDVVVGLYSSNVVSVMLGSGGGSLAPRVNYGTASQPYNSLVLYDLSNDGKLDILIPCANNNTVDVFYNNGNGTFSGRNVPSTSTSARPSSMAMGDFNGDGKLDFVTANANSNNIGIFINQGNSNYAGQQFAYGTNSTPFSVAVADINNDGKQDIVVVNRSSNNFTTYFGQGNGQFITQTSYAIPSSPSWIVTSDVNSDGNQDVLVTNDGNHLLSVFLGNGTGAYNSRVDYPTGISPYQVLPADLNGDGVLDLVIGNASVATFSIMLGKGDGTFPSRVDLPTNGVTYAVAVGNMNGDNKPDIVVTNPNNNTVGVLLNQSQ